MKNALAKYLPEQRIYIRTDSATRFFTLTSGTQLFLGLLLTLSVSWLMIATATLGFQMFEAKSATQQAQELKLAYETRLNRISIERDNRALEAQTAQDQFYVALNQISQQQTDLLEAEEQRRELATGLQILQTKLQDAVKARDVAVRNSDQLLGELQDLSGTTTNRLGAAEELNKTLALVSEQLDYSVNQRAELDTQATQAKEQTQELLLNAELAQIQNEQIFSRLEQAVEISLTPLERALNKSGINTKSLVDEVRKGYSGTGGPLTSLTVSTKGTAAGPDSTRAFGLLKDLERVNLLKIAAQHVPLSHPVAGSYRYTSGFGGRRDPKTRGWRQHNGTDMAGPLNTPIVAAGDGVVTFAGRQSGYGRLIKIKHKQGFETFYAHLNKMYVKAGQKVSRGDKIGGMGNSGRSTGVHLHYEIRIGGKPVNAMQYIKAAKDVF